MVSLCPCPPCCIILLYILKTLPIVFTKLLTISTWKALAAQVNQISIADLLVAMSWFRYLCARIRWPYRTHAVRNNPAHVDGTVDDQKSFVPSRESNQEAERKL